MLKERLFKSNTLLIKLILKQTHLNTQYIFNELNLYKISVFIH